MLVHLKVATEVPADVFAVTFNNSALFGFHLIISRRSVPLASLWFGLLCFYVSFVFISVSLFIVSPVPSNLLSQTSGVALKY